MRPCVPFSLSRLSQSAHRNLVCPYVLSSSSSPSSSSLPAPTSTSSIKLAGTRPFSSTAQISGLPEATVSIPSLDGQKSMPDSVDTSPAENQPQQSGGRLAFWLRDQKEAFLDDLNRGKGKGWTVVMGNEAGDLDSLASSIAYAHLSSTLRASRAVPLALTPSSYMSLRPENLLAFQLAHIPLSSLLHPEQLPIPTLELGKRGVEFALVDHNRLLPAFQGNVNAVIDHHDDEHAHTDAAVREITVPTGSCTSLVAKHFKKEWVASLSSPAGAKGSPVPPEVATLLLSGMLIDTGGLKQGGKATSNDYDSASFLYPISTLADPNTSLSTSSFDSAVPPSLTSTASQLLTTKMDVSNLSTHDLLLRDYKEYTLPTSSSSFPSLKAGLSTVPLGLKKWLAKESPASWQGLLKGVDQYMSERDLDIEGILTTFTSEQKGKHRRELVLVIRSGEGRAIGSPSDAKRVLDELSQGLEGSGDLLELAEWDKLGPFAVDEFRNEDGSRVGKAWKQGNTKSTRKQVAPLLRDLVAKLQ